MFRNHQFHRRNNGRTSSTRNDLLGQGYRLMGHGRNVIDKSYDELMQEILAGDASVIDGLHESIGNRNVLSLMSRNTGQVQNNSSNDKLDGNQDVLHNNSENKDALVNADNDQSDNAITVSTQDDTQAIEQNNNESKSGDNDSKEDGIQSVDDFLKDYERVKSPKNYLSKYYDFVIYRNKTKKKELVLGKRLKPAREIGNILEGSYDAELKTAQNEQNILKGLAHKNIIAFKMIVEHKGDLRNELVMEKGNGNATRMMEKYSNKENYNRKKRSKIAVLDLKDYRDICNALNYLYNKGLAHCDLKLENMVHVLDEASNKPILKLIDIQGNPYLTKLETGTPDYIPPKGWEFDESETSRSNYLNSMTNMDKNNIQLELMKERDMWGMGCCIQIMLSSYGFWDEPEDDHLKAAKELSLILTNSDPKKWIQPEQIHKVLKAICKMKDKEVDMEKFPKIKHYKLYKIKTKKQSSAALSLPF